MMRRLVTALTSEIGVDEVMPAIGLGLLAYGLWLAWAPGAFIAPGLVVLWTYLPARVPFVVRPVEKPRSRRSE
jgi:hypothetical protein